MAETKMEMLVSIPTNVSISVWGRMEEILSITGDLLFNFNYLADLFLFVEFYAILLLSFISFFIWR